MPLPTAELAVFDSEPCFCFNECGRVWALPVCLTTALVPWWLNEKGALLILCAVAGSQTMPSFSRGRILPPGFAFPVPLEQGLQDCTAAASNVRWCPTEFDDRPTRTRNTTGATPPNAEPGRLALRCARLEDVCAWAELAFLRCLLGGVGDDDKLQYQQQMSFYSVVGNVQ